MGVKWVAANKGHDEYPEHRCRLAAKEIKRHKRADLPQQCLLRKRGRCYTRFGQACHECVWTSRCGACSPSRPGKWKSVCKFSSMEDVEEDRRGLLKNAVYGTRDAAQNWEMECTEMTVDVGLR